MERIGQSSVLHALAGTRVLVVEDDVLLLMELESILLDAGAVIVGLCRTVEDALAVIGGDGVAAAILDVRIGRQSIAPVARKLAGQGTPFVFYTGQIASDPDLREWRGRKIISKPARADSIVAAVAKLVGTNQPPASA